MDNPSRQPSFEEIYRDFSLPLTEIDCGKKCGPYNDYGVPVCCDINILVPAAYQEEWTFLDAKTDLWRPWRGPSEREREALELDLQPGQVLLQCLGYQRCQRPFRTITCRAFPFYPYLTGAGTFAGLAYYREFREQCWVISNLSRVSQAYKNQFRKAFQRLFQIYPETRQDFSGYSSYLREKAASNQESLVVLDFSGRVLLVDPGSETTTLCDYNDLESYGPFAVTRDLIFPDEEQDLPAGSNHER